jgi:cytochrome c peroxidase
LLAATAEQGDRSAAEELFSAKHIGRVKGPILRGLARRAPYFHNGSAATLPDAVEFYDRRFGIGLTPQEKADLSIFLSAL